MVTFSEFITAKETIEAYIMAQGTSFSLSDVTLDSGRVLVSCENTYNLAGGVKQNALVFVTAEEGLQ
jgi:hypothetical protein